jgi:5,10-methylenetetrahydromethanopterin reductase
VMASVYYFYDAVHERGIDPPPFLQRIWRRYCALVEATPAAHRHFRTHEGHYTYLHPGEAELIDAELVRATCLVGEADELIERIRELERGGLRELMFATGVDEKWRFSQEFARRVMERY